MKIILTIGYTYIIGGLLGAAYSLITMNYTSLVISSLASPLCIALGLVLILFIHPDCQASHDNIVLRESRDPSLQGSIKQEEAWQS